MPPVVSVENLAKRFGRIVAVEQISFAVSPGEVFGLLGPNGAGKTTTFECALGLRDFDSGRVLLNGVDVQSRPRQARNCVGALLQGGALQDKITVREALKLFASFHPRPARIDDLIERFMLGEKADASYESLSSGQKQRLGLALAFINQPRVVFLDEPTAALDVQSRRQLQAMIFAAAAQGCAVLISTHDLQEAQQLCDQVAIIDHGRLIAIGKPAELPIAQTMTPRIFIRTEIELDVSVLSSLVGVSSASGVNGGWELTADDPDRILAVLLQLLQTQSNRLIELSLRRPTLEEIFLKLTSQQAGN